MFEASFRFTLSSKDKQMLVVSGHEYYLKRKNKTTTNWNCSKYQTHKCRATAITEGENFIETRGQHNHDISTSKPDARLVLKNIKELSDSNTPTVAVATAIQPITDNIATQLALPSKENLVRTAQRARKQREEVLPVSPANRSFEIPEIFKKFYKIWQLVMLVELMLILKMKFVLRAFFFCLLKSNLNGFLILLCFDCKTSFDFRFVCSENLQYYSLTFFFSWNNILTNFE